MSYVSVRVMFESIDVAVEVLLKVLTHARTTTQNYTFGALSAEQIYDSGLVIMGDAEDLVEQIEAIDGTTVYAE